MSHVIIKLAAALLLKRREISLSDIEALPFVENESIARSVVRRLQELFDTYVDERTVGESWEDVLVLRTPMPGSLT